MLSTISFIRMPIFFPLALLLFNFQLVQILGCGETGMLHINFHYDLPICFLSLDHPLLKDKGRRQT